MRRAHDLVDGRDVPAVVALLGLAMLSLGAWFVFAPLGLIVPGTAFLILGFWRLR